MHRKRGTDADRTTRREASRRRNRRGDHGSENRNRRDHRSVGPKVGASAQRQSRGAGARKKAIQKGPDRDCQSSRIGKVVKMSDVEWTKQDEIDANLSFFQKKLPELLEKHRDKYALLKDEEVVAFYDTVVDAQTTGEKLYQDGIFSVQKVTDTSINLGFYSYAMHLGAA
jgi:hypothetical protein